MMKHPEQVPTNGLSIIRTEQNIRYWLTKDTSYWVIANNLFPSRLAAVNHPPGGEIDALRYMGAIWHDIEQHLTSPNGPDESGVRCKHWITS